MAVLQKIKHSADDICAEEPAIIIHVVDEVESGGEFTMCGRAIPDANYEINGWAAVGNEYRGSWRKCTCYACTKLIRYIKGLR